LGGSVIGNLTMGFLSDKIGGKMAFSACLVLGLVALVWLLFAREIWMFYLFAFVFGLVVGGTNPLTTVVSAELFGLKSLGAIFGGTMLVGTIGGSMGAIVAGSIFDLTESYTIAFLICIALTVVALILSLVILRYKVELAKS
jgi:MFS family permease